MKKENTSEYVSRTSKEYAIYVCENRAIPKVSDGLKDGQRKALWVARNKSEKIKTVALSGELISQNLYLHGDVSASEAISALAAPYINNITYFEGIGTFGTRVSPTGWGAPRYTYVKKSKASQSILYPDLAIVPLKDNYDGSNVEPVHFLPIIPTVLLNGISGIAVGWSTEILPHKLDDLIEACELAIDDKKIKRLIPNYSKYNVTVTNIENNSWEICGLVDIVDHQTVRVLELPPDLSVEKFKDRLNEFEDSDKIKDYTDKSTDHISITIQFKRGELKGWSKDQVLDFLKLKSKKTERIVVLDWNNTSIKQYENPEILVKDFVNWRLGWYKTRYETLLANTETERNFYRALRTCFEQKLPQKILTLTNKQSVRTEVEQITAKFKLNDDQIERIVTMPSYRWTKDCLEEISHKVLELNDLIGLYDKILSDPKEIKKIYKQELTDLKKLKF